MNRIISIALLVLLLLVWPQWGVAQFFFKALAGKSATVAGKPFQLQYVVENTGKVTRMEEPTLTGLKKVSGPNIYTAFISEKGRHMAVKNYVYTVVAMLPGRYTIPPVTCECGSKTGKSNTLYIEVEKDSEDIKIEKAASSLLGGNAEKVMNASIKIITRVDKRVAYVGEPVTVMYRLLSAIESKSAITNNPAFLGFSVQDISHLPSEAYENITINGKKYESYLLRHTKLYPLQQGTFYADEMEVQNKVTVLVEGNRQEYYNITQSTPVPIVVKPLPIKAGHDTFIGPVGHFTLSATVNKATGFRNEPVLFTLRLQGDGNTKTCLPPAIKWPPGIEAGEPSITDSILFAEGAYKNVRSFDYSCTVTDTGKHVFMPIEIPCFSTNSYTYTELRTKPVLYTCTGEKPIAKKALTFLRQNKRASFLYILLPIIIATVVVFSFLLAKKKKTQQKNKALMVQDSKPIFLLPPREQLNALDDRSFSLQYRQLLMDVAVYKNISLEQLTLQYPLLGNMAQSCVHTAYAHSLLEYNRNDMLQELERAIS